MGNRMCVSAIFMFPYEVCVFFGGGRGGSGGSNNVRLCRKRGMTLRGFIYGWSRVVHLRWLICVASSTMVDLRRFISDGWSTLLHLRWLIYVGPLKGKPKLAIWDVTSFFVASCCSETQIGLKPRRSMGTLFRTSCWPNPTNTTPNGYKILHQWNCHDLDEISYNWHDKNIANTCKYRRNDNCHVQVQW